MPALKVVVANPVGENMKSFWKIVEKFYKPSESTHCLMTERIDLCGEAVG